jgi:hypothetical protein
MVVGLDGIEKIILALDRNTMKPATFECVGYQSKGFGLPMEEMYRKIGATQGDRAYVAEDIINFSASQNVQPKVYSLSSMPQIFYEGLKR